MQSAVVPFLYISIMPAEALPLSDYLDRIESACRPPKAWTRACETVMETVEHVLDDHYGVSGPKVKAQGSFVQSLSIRGSDLDLVLYRKGRSINSCSKNCVKRYLTTATDAVIRSLAHLNGEVKTRVKQRILHARVPIVKLVFEVRPNSIDLDSSSSSSAASTTSTSSDGESDDGYVKGKPQMIEVDMSYGDEHRGECDEIIRGLISAGGPTCRKFVTLVKLWGRISGVTDSFNNCLSTFALILLAIYHFQSMEIMERRKRKGRKSSIDVASLLSSFFNWVAYSFHCEVVEVDVEEHKMVSRAPSTYCPMFIKVPRDSFANAARCLSNSQWRNRVLPAFRTAAASCRGTRWTELFGDRQTRLMPQVTEEDIFESSSSCISDVESLEEIEVVSEKRKKIARWRQDYTTLSLSSNSSSSSSSSSSTESREEILLSDDDDDEIVEVEEAPSSRKRKRAAGKVFDGERMTRNRKRMKRTEFGEGRMSGKKRARQNQRQKRQNKRSY